MADNIEKLTLDEAVALTEKLSVDELCARAGALRTEHLGNDFDTCTIINARSGRCSENCKWCAQSSHWGAACDKYSLKLGSEVLQQARYNADKGVRRFSMVTSGRAISLSELSRAADAMTTISRRVPRLELCASMGLLGPKELQLLWDAGVRRYHCNLETAPSFFDQLCTTHTIEEKVDTIRAARGVGMEVCSGGIIGMGETRRQRIELAIALRSLGIMSIPVNVLSPIEGTPLAGMAPLSDDEVLIAMAMFRIINPRAHIRLAGGRERIKHLERKLLHSGVSAAIVGDMLTTAGSNIDTDFTMVAEEGFAV